MRRSLRGELRKNAGIKCNGCMSRLPKTLYLVTLCASLFYGNTAHARVVISEVFWSGSDRSSSDEWLEITKVPDVGEAEDMPLDGWSVSYLPSSGVEAVMFVFASGSVIGDFETLLIANDPAAVSRLSIEPDIVTTAVSLPNSKLLLRLKNSEGATIDEVDDGTGNPFAGSNPAVSGKASMERIDPYRPGNVSENWRTATETMNFDPGEVIFGTPGFTPWEASVASTSSSVLVSEQTSSASGGIMDSSSSNAESGVLVSLTQTGAVFLSASSVPSAESSSMSGSQSTLQQDLGVLLPAPPHIVINEVLANPVGSQENEWIEMRNLSKAVVNMGGWVIEKGGGSSSWYEFPRLGSGMLLAPGEFMVVRKAESRISLDNEGGELVLRRGTQFVDAFSYPKTAEGVSYGRMQEKIGNFLPFCVPTERSENTDDDINPRIGIQSQTVDDDGSVLINLNAEIGGGLLSSATCQWDFGEGLIGGSCNPPSHRFSLPKRHVVRLVMQSYCGRSVERSLAFTIQASASRQAATVLGEQHAPAIMSGSVQTCIENGSGVLLTRILPRPLPQAQEEIVLTNVTKQRIGLCGWSISDASKKQFTLDAVTIDAGASFVLTGSQSRIILNNDGDTLTLLPPGGALPQVVTYGSTGIGKSWTREQGGDWEQEGNSTIASASGAALRVNLANALPLQVGLVSALPKPMPLGREWVELSVMAGSGGSLDGWSIDTGTLRKTPLAGIIVEPGKKAKIEYPKIRLRDENGLVRLLNPAGAVAGSIAWVRATEGQLYSVETTEASTLDRVMASLQKGDVLSTAGGRQNPSPVVVRATRVRVSPQSRVAAVRRIAARPVVQQWIEPLPETVIGGPVLAENREVRKKRTMWGAIAALALASVLLVWFVWKKMPAEEQGSGKKVESPL